LTGFYSSLLGFAQDGVLDHDCREEQDQLPFVAKGPVSAIGFLRAKEIASYVGDQQKRE
jgi:hypothetical protein